MQLHVDKWKCHDFPIRSYLAGRNENPVIMYNWVVWLFTFFNGI